MDYVMRNGKIQTHGLEIHAAEHCNLRCAGCSQSSPFLSPSFPQLSQIEHCLELLSRVLHTERATILGGEPLLNTEIVELLRIVRASGVSDRLFLTTNGLLLRDASDAFWKLVDVVEVSVYPATREKLLRQLPMLFEKAWNSNTELRIMPTPSFSQITLTKAIADDAFVDFIYEKCYFRHYCHTLHDGYIYRCGPSTTLADLLAHVHGARPEFTDSALPVEEKPDFQDRLLRFLRDANPMEVCRYCLGSSGGTFRHRQLREDETGGVSDVVYSEDVLRESIAAEWRSTREDSKDIIQ